VGVLAEGLAMSDRRAVPDLIGRVADRPREYAKLALRTLLHRRHLDLVSHPYPVRVATTLSWFGVQTVLDIGANIGQYGTALRASGYRGNLVSCEPLSDAFEHLQRRSARDPGWEAVRTAVGDEVGSIEINVSANSYSSSLLPMTSAHSDAAPGSEFVAAETVPVTTVAELIAARNLNPARTLLKIDTQGYEAPVLDGAGSALKEFAAVSLELSFVPLYEGQQLFDELTSRLKGAGYTLYGLDAGFGDPRTGRMLQCDGLFVRTELLDRAS
jgi:FkbM family methyltransferase